SSRRAPARPWTRWRRPPAWCSCSGGIGACGRNGSSGARGPSPPLEVLLDSLRWAELLGVHCLAARLRRARGELGPGERLNLEVEYGGSSIVQRAVGATDSAIDNLV